MATEPTTDVAVTEPRTSRSFDDRRALCAALAQSDIAPAHFRNRPANVLLVSLAAEALDLDLFTAMQELYVVQGKIGMSAGLTATLVRKAGHRLRVIETTATSATVEIVRHDDPEAPFRVTWTMEDAKRAGLSGGSWNKYPAAMLVARATTAAARLACPEALSGIGYTPEELGQDEPLDSGSVAVSAAASPAPAPATNDVPATEPDIIDAEIIPDEPPAEVTRSTHADPGEWATDPGAAVVEGKPAAAPGKRGRGKGWATPAMLEEIARRLTAAGFGPAPEALRVAIGQIIGREIESSAELTAVDVDKVLEALATALSPEDLAAAVSTGEAMREAYGITDGGES